MNTSRNLPDTWALTPFYPRHARDHFWREEDRRSTFLAAAHDEPTRGHPERIADDRADDRLLNDHAIQIEPSHMAELAVGYHVDIVQPRGKRAGRLRPRRLGRPSREGKASGPPGGLRSSARS
jgi:hypothetical protein